MKYLISLCLLTLSACGSGNAPSLAEAQQKGAQYRVAADAFMGNVLGVDGCPAGTHAYQTKIGTSTAASISMDSGRVQYGAYSAGDRSNGCH